MVSLCGGCNVYQPWGAILVGIMGGFGFILTHYLMLKCKFDDPLDAVAVHGTSGIIGVIFVPIFDWEKGIFVNNNSDHNPWMTLGVNIGGIFAISAWSVFWSFILFFTLKKLKLLRVDRDTEFRGSDLPKHGEAAYPADAWVEVQYSRQGSTSNIPSNMKGPEECKLNKSHTDPFEMVPTTGKLATQMNNFTKGFEEDSNKLEEDKKNNSMENGAYLSNE